MWAVEDELDELTRDIAKADRRVNELERAPYEGRVADPDGWERSLHFARQQVKDLRAERAALQAQLDAEEAS